MNLQSMLDKSSQSAAWLWLLNHALAFKIPFNRPHGFRIIRISSEQIHVRLPYSKKNLNHIRGIHACALATLCEFTSGVMLARFFPAESFRLILKSIFITYHYQARTHVYATFCPDKERINSEIISVLANQDSVFKAFEVEVFDENKNHICSAQVTWQIKKWKAVRTRP